MQKLDKASRIERSAQLHVQVSPSAQSKPVERSKEK
jgi:hypothetical protein